MAELRFGQTKRTRSGRALTLALNPENGWGQFDGEHGAFEFLRAFLKACEEHPKAIIGVSA